MEIATVDSF